MKYRYTDQQFEIEESGNAVAVILERVYLDHNDKFPIEEKVLTCYYNGREWDLIQVRLENQMFIKARLEQIYAEKSRGMV